MKTWVSNHQALRLIMVVGLAALCLTILLSWVSVSSAVAVAPSSVGQDINAPNNGSVITIGIAAALSEPVGGLGWRQANAVQLAISQTNEAGGVEIGGAFYTLTVVRVDSMCSDTEAVTAANTLLDAGVVVVVGHTCSGASLSAQPLYNAAGVAMVSPSSTSPQLTEEGYTTTFRVISRDDAGAILLATYFYDALGLDQAAIVEWNDVEWASDAFASTFAGLGGTITSQHTVTSTDDYTTTLTTIKAEGPAAIYCAIPDADDAGLLSRVAHNLGMDDLAMGWDSVWSGDLDAYATAAGPATEGDYAALPFRRTENMPGYDQLNAEYQAAGFPNHGDEADTWGAFAYDAAQIIIAAIERAASADTLAIRDEIAATTDYDGVVGTYEDFDAKGDVIPQWTWMEQYQNGQWVRVRTTPTRTWYVHPNGLDSDTGTLGLPFKTIQYAIDRAEDGDLILVAAGTYTENLTIGKMLTLRDGYTMSGTAWLPSAGETVVDANGADNAVIWITPGVNVTVEGFTVQGANHTSGEGGGFFIDRATVVISGTVVRNNSAQNGGGIWVEKWEGYPGSLSLINSSLLTNTASTRGGGGLSTSGEPIVTLDNVDVRGNAAQHEGGGLSVHNVTITNSRIVSNTAGGPGCGIAANVAYIYNSEISDNEVDGAGATSGGGIMSWSHLVIRDSTVSNNRAAGECQGGGINAEGEATIVNTVISGNSVSTGPAGVMVNAVLTMTNCLVVSNTSDGQNFQGYITGTIVNVTVADNPGGGMHVGGAVVIINSIIWGNEGGDYWCVPGGCTLAYSDVGIGDSTGAGNISADPQFVDAANGDYHLKPGSPCIDTGTSAGAPATDIEGTARDATPDMGAYEWAGFRIFLPLVLRNS